MSKFQFTDFEENPYRSPPEIGETPIVGDEAGPVVTPTVLAMLSQTQPWVRFLSVLGFIVSGLMVLIGLVGLFGFAAIGRGMGLILLLYIPMALLYFIPSLFLFRYASRIADLRITRGVVELEDALAAQKSFWKFVGIAALIVIFLYVAAIAVFAFLPLAMRGMRWQ
jgi:hypothetical protein